MCEKLTLFPYRQYILETSDYWLSEDVVSLKIEVGFTRNLQKCNSHFTKKSHIAATMIGG